jgi:hypothetical protein
MNPRSTSDTHIWEALVQAIDVLPYLVTIAVTVVLESLVFSPIWELVHKARAAEKAVKDRSKESWIAQVHIHTLREMATQANWRYRWARKFFGEEAPYFWGLYELAVEHVRLRTAESTIQTVAGLTSLSPRRRRCLAWSSMGVLLLESGIDPERMAQLERLYQRAFD